MAAHVSALDPDALIVDQDDVPGTGRAVEVAWKRSTRSTPGRLDGTVVVTYGDVPLLTGGLLGELVAAHDAEGNAVTVLTAVLEDATGYGRILRAADGTVTGIREHKDATEPNAASAKSTPASTPSTPPSCATRSPRHHRQRPGRKVPHRCPGPGPRRGGRVAAVVTEDRWQVEGANDRVQLAALGAELNRRTLELDARRRHRRGPGHHLDRFTVTLETTSAPARHPTARRHHGGARRRRRPGHHADRRRRWARAPR